MCVYSVNEPRDATPHDAGKPTPSVATATQDSKSSKKERRDAVRNDAGKPTQSITTPVVATPTQDALYSVREQRNVVRHHNGKTTPYVATCIVATPTEFKIMPKEASKRHTKRCWQTDAERRDADKNIFRVDEASDAIPHDAGKPTPNVVMRIVATPTHNSKSSPETPRDAIQYDPGSPTPSVATPHKVPHLAQTRKRMKFDTTLENRRRASGNLSL
jgi:inner membrane protein involved in colicin E2 resistance